MDEVAKQRLPEENGAAGNGSGDDAELKQDGGNGGGRGRLAWFRKNKWKLVATSLVVLARISMGLYYEMSTPTLPDLAARTGSDYEEVSRALVFINAAFLVGSLLGGFFTDRFQKHIGLVMFISQMCAVVGTAAAPWCTDITALSAMFFLVGCGIGPVNAAGGGWLVWMWRDQLSAPIHLYHWAFGIGAMFSPLIAEPFISDFPELNGTETADTFADADGPIEIPYAIAAGLTFLVALAVLVLHFLERAYRRGHRPLGDAGDGDTGGGSRVVHGLTMDYAHHEHETGQKQSLAVLNPASCADGRLGFGSLMVGLIFCFHFIVVAGERVWGKFLVAWTRQSGQGWTKEEAAYLTTLFWFAFFAGRGLATLVASWVRPNIMVTTELVCYLASAVALALFGADSKTAIWVCTGLIGFFVAPLFPGNTAVCSQFINISAMIIGLMEAGAGFGGMLWSWIGGYFLEYHGTSSLLYFHLGYTLLLCFVYIIIQVVGHLGNKTRKVEVPAVPEMYTPVPDDPAPTIDDKNL